MVPDSLVWGRTPVVDNSSSASKRRVDAEDVPDQSIKTVAQMIAAAAVAEIGSVMR